MLCLAKSLKPYSTFTYGATAFAVLDATLDESTLNGQESKDHGLEVFLSLATPCVFHRSDSRYSTGRR